MPLAATEGIILKRIRLGETSKILTVLTPAYGKIKLVAKGARKPKHRYGSGMEPFSVCSIVFYHRSDRDLQLLSQCDTQESHLRFAGDLRRLAYGSAALEMADRVVLEGESTAEVYGLVVDAIGRMEHAGPAELPLLWWAYQLKMLEALGYRPQLERCGRCGRPVTGRRVRFDMAEGGVRCSSCASPREPGVSLREPGVSLREPGVSPLEESISAGSLRALTFLSGASWEEIRSLRVSRGQAGEIENLLSRFMAGRFGESFRIKSLGILRSIRKREKDSGFSNAHHAA